MKSTRCSFTIHGMDMECPACGELVQSGYRHQCETDGDITERMTFPVGGTVGSNLDQNGTARKAGTETEGVEKAK